jgi:hypothetical protein
MHAAHVPATYVAAAHVPAAEATHVAATAAVSVGSPRRRNRTKTEGRNQRNRQNAFHEAVLPGKGREPKNSGKLFPRGFPCPALVFFTA